MTIIAVLDFETSGLTLPACAELKNQPRMIEFGMAKVEGGSGRVLDTFGQLVNPEEQITEEITKITGITNDMLADKPNFRALAPLLCFKMRGCDILLAHNAPFDRAILEYEIKRMQPFDFPLPQETICTVQEFRHLLGRNIRLPELYEHYVGKPLGTHHRALDDVLSLVEALTAAKFWEALT